MQHFHSIIFQDLKQLNWNFITSTSFVHSDAFYVPLDFTFQMSDHTIVIILVMKIFFVQFFCVFLPPPPNIFCGCDSTQAWPRGATPHLRSGQKLREPHAQGAAAKRSYPTSEVRGSGLEELPHV